MIVEFAKQLSQTLEEIKSQGLFKTERVITSPQDAHIAITGGKRVLIAAHGNSLRALVKYLDGISDADIVELNIPTGIPLVYELDAKLAPIKSYYLGDPEAAKRAAERVAAQAKGG